MTTLTVEEMRQLVLFPVNYGDTPKGWEQLEQLNRILAPNSIFDDPYDLTWMGPVNGHSLFRQLMHVDCVSSRCTIGQFRTMRDQGYLREYSFGDRGTRLDRGQVHLLDGWLIGETIQRGRRVFICAALDDQERRKLEHLGSLHPLENR